MSINTHNTICVFTTFSQHVRFVCFSIQTCRSMWSQIASRPWTFWRKALPTESRQQPTTMTPAADPTPSSPSSTHRSPYLPALPALSAHIQLYSSVNDLFCRFHYDFVCLFTTGNPRKQPSLWNCQQDKPGGLGWEVKLFFSFCCVFYLNIFSVEVIDKTAP